MRAGCRKCKIKLFYSIWKDCCRPAKTLVTHWMLWGMSWSLPGLDSWVSPGASSPVVVGSGCRSEGFAGKIPVKRQLGWFIHSGAEAARWERSVRTRVCGAGELGWTGGAWQPREDGFYGRLFMYFSMCWKELSNQLKMFHGPGKFIAATV